MKQRTLLLASAIAGLVVIFFVLSSAISFGPKIEVSGNVVLPKNEVFVGTYLRAASDVEINGTIEGDVFIAAQNITINGMVRGNVYLAAANINVNGNIGGAVHAAAQNVNITGSIDQNIVTAGATVNIGSGEENDRIGGGVMAAGSVVKVNSFVASDLYAAGENLILNSEIRGNARLAGNNITLEQNALVNGNVKYVSENDLQQKDGSKVIGSTEKIADKTKPSTATQLKQNLAWALFGVLSTTLIGAILLRSLPKTTREIAARVRNNFLKSLGAGWLFIITVPLISLLLLPTLIGMKLALIMIFVYAPILLLGGLYVALAIGNLILPEEKKDLVNGLSALLVGLVILGIIRFIPIVNVLFALIVSPAGIGALVLHLRDGYRAIREKEQKAIKAKA